MNRAKRMSRPVLGLLLGTALGLVDGASAFFYPELAGAMLTVILGSTLKGVIAGAAIGYISKKVQSLPVGIAAGLAIGTALSYLVTRTADPGLFWDIMLPGMLLGVIVGFATQKFGEPPEPAGQPR